MHAATDPVRQASAGEADARFARAADLLAQPDSPDAFAAGIALVEAAAAHDHAEALAMLAAIEAIGAGRQRNWSRAVACLRRAAARGSAHARGQLEVLGAPDDPGRLLAAPEPVALAERPRLRVFPGFARPAECQWLIGRLGPRLARALVWDEISGAAIVDPARTGSAVELRLAEMDVVAAVLRARIAAATRLPEPIFEVPQLMHYAPGEEFTVHHDYLDPNHPGHAADIVRRGQRIGTFLICLNQDFEGGATEFPRAGLAWRGRMGDALFFANVTPDGAPDPLTFHAGRPPRAGEKWLFSQWIRDRAPGPAVR
jgi:prolyl 4-hydroxylase